MPTVREHYEQFLAKNYTWMVGQSIEDKSEEQLELLKMAGISAPGIAVDLGCGPGYQSLALLDLGARHVHAIDFNQRLLDHLGQQTRGLQVDLHNADIIDFHHILHGPVDTVVCMGDTLTHLASLEDVESLISNIAAMLSKSGRVVISWRDLTRTPSGLDRFIQVRASDDKIMLCFLEDQGDRVLVHDLLHVRTPQGWTLEKSAYPKLKIPVEWLHASLSNAGLEILHSDVHRGMTVTTAGR